MEEATGSEASDVIQLLGTGHADYLEEAMEEGGRVAIPGDPGSGIAFDERVVASFRRMLGETPMEVAIEYDGDLGNDRGMDDMLEKFIDRNTQYMSQSQELKLKKLFRSCNLLAQSARQMGEADYAKMLKEVIRDKVYPMIRDIVQRKNQKQYAEASIDAVPSDLQGEDYGDARKVGPSQAQATGKLRDAIRRQAAELLGQSREWQILRAAKQTADQTVNPGPSVQAAVAKAEIGFMRLQQKIWSAYSADNGGVFEAEVRNIQKGISEQQRRLLALTQEQHGHGYASALSNSMGRRDIQQRQRPGVKYAKADVLPQPPWRKPSDAYQPSGAHVLHTQAGGVRPCRKIPGPASAIPFRECTEPQGWTRAATR